MAPLEGQINSWVYFKDLFFEKVTGASLPRAETSSDWTSVSGAYPGARDITALAGSYEKGGAFPLQEALETLSKKIRCIKSVEGLTSNLIAIIHQYIDTSHSSVMLMDTSNTYAAIADSRGRIGRKIPPGFVKVQKTRAVFRFFESPFAQTLTRDGVVLFDDLSNIIHMGGCEEVNDDEGLDLLKEMLEDLTLLNASLCAPLIINDELRGHLFLGEKTNGQDFFSDEISFIATAANNAALAIDYLNLKGKLDAKTSDITYLRQRSENLCLHFALTLTSAIEARDPATFAHVQRVSHYTMMIAEQMEDNEEVKKIDNFDQTLWLAALLHDVGKIGVADGILCKPSRLTPTEYESMKKHPAIGAAILSPLKEFDGIREAIEAHQERYNGTGYPKGLAGKDIPICARIIAVADALDAIVSKRCYKQKVFPIVALDEIEKYSGEFFDPDVVKALLLAYKKGKILPNAF